MNKEPYQWIAWNDNRERICDAGSAKATSHDEAFAIARVCLGGPHARSVVVFEIADIMPERTTRKFYRVDGTEVTK